MSILYSFSLTLNTKFSRESVKNILQCGSEKNFVYYDYVFEKPYEEFPILDVDQATDRALSDNNYSGVYIFLDSYRRLNFYKSDNDLLQFSIEHLMSPKQKIFSDNYPFIDWAYYIRFALDICKSFAIVSIKIQEIH